MHVLLLLLLSSSSFEKAYDSVTLQNLWKALERYSIHIHIIRAINSVY